jgi:hypothetical protein
MLRKVNNLDMDRWRSIKMESAFLRSLIQSGKTKRKKHLLYHHGNLRRIILGWKLDTDTAEEKSKFFSKFLRRKNFLQHQSGKKNKNE